MQRLHTTRFRWHHRCYSWYALWNSVYFVEQRCLSFSCPWVLQALRRWRKWKNHGQLLFLFV